MRSAAGADDLDHADVVAAPELSADDGAIKIRVPIDLFLVSRDQVMAAPNTTPAGATTPAARVALDCRLVTDGAKFSLQDFSSDPAGTPLPPDLQLPVSIDLGGRLAQLNLPKPGSSRADLVGDVVAIRFDPVGGPVERLFASQQWGLFLDGPTVESLATAAIPVDRLKSVVPSATASGHWNPRGDVPHVDIEVRGKMAVPNPFKVEITLSAPTDLSVVPQDILRSDVHWSVHVDLGEFVPGYFETKAEEFVAAAMNPSQFGGTPTSDSSFVIDKPLLPIEFSGARLSYDSALASSAGMTLGGAVTLPLDVGHDTVQVIARSFGPAKMLVLCSQSHGAPKDLQARFVTTTGEASFNFAGALCGCEFLAPNDGLDQYATGTATNVGGTQDIWVRLNGAVALGVKEPVRIVVRTARGVRLVDLGVPAHVTINSDGFVENVEITYYDDCIYLRKPPFDNRADWFARFINRLIDPEPIEWTSFAERGAGLSVQLVNLTGLESGELVQFRSPTHAIDVTANRHGAVTLPAMMRLRGPPQPAFMIRVNQQSIAGHVVSRAALFERRATLRAGRATRLAEFDKGMALVSAEFGNRVETHLIGDLGVFTRVERDHPRVALAPCESAFSCDLPGLVSLLRVPGFGDAPIAIAVMADDTKLIVEQDGDGFRVAGAFVGPIGAMTELGEWATLTSGQQVFVYAVTRAAEKRPAMHEDEPASNGPKEHPCDCG